MVEELRLFGFEVIECVGGYGVVGIMCNGEGLMVFVWVDMDVLLIVEDIGLLYVSIVIIKDDVGNEVGVMYVCGYDIYMMVWIGVVW